MSNIAGKSEVVICDSEDARNAHRELFRFDESQYVTVARAGGAFDLVEDMVALCRSAPVSPSRLHLVLSWPGLLQVSLWLPRRPSAADVSMLLTSAGAAELQSFKESDADDLFSWLYHGGRFEVFRRLCHAAKRQVENRLQEQSVSIECHLFAEDTKRIVASSL